MDDLQKDIAIIGMSGRFPKSPDLDKFWLNLREGVECISFFTDSELRASGVDHDLSSKPEYVRARGIIEHIDLFDAAFFSFNPREAAITDPQQRLFLECAWIGLEDAGHDPDRYEGLIGVYAGSSHSSYFINNLIQNGNLLNSVNAFQVNIGNDKDYLSTRVSYKLNLKGPSLTVQTACSTSLVAVVQACQSLLAYQCDIALAGGVSLSVPQREGYLYQEGMIFSPDGHCRAFDAKAHGTVLGEGVGVVVLKRLVDALADGDRIRAVIKGAAVNNDGSMKVGFTAPSVDGQAEVIAMAQAMAGIDAETVSYVEAHGTGTQMGDPIELAALTKAFRFSTDKIGYCAIGSLKTNIGHADAAAGVAGLIKTVLALEHKQLPPSLHFKEPNPEIDFKNSPFYVNTSLSEWKANGSARRAGVSAFGIGGTNAHVILEEAPPKELSSPSRSWQLLVLSAKTASTLDVIGKRLSDFLKGRNEVNLADVAFTLQTGRKRFSNRRIIVCQDLEGAVRALDAPVSQGVNSQVGVSENRRVIFMFSGQGSQYVKMGLALYQEEQTFREQVDLCADIIKQNEGYDIRDLLYPEEKRVAEASQELSQTGFTQPAVFLIEYALAKLLNEWGIRPVAMIGHSIGEYVAACLSGVFSLEDALALVCMRGRLIQTLPSGSMLAVALSEQEALSLLNKNLALAAVNSPKMCVISGSVDAIDDLEKELISKGVGYSHLHTSHAFHSHMMDPILESFYENMRKIKLQQPENRYISNVTGTWIAAEQATDPAYWVKHLRQTVRFSSGVAVVLKDGDGIFLEVGPGRVLSTLVKQHATSSEGPLILSTLRHPREQESDSAFLLKSIGRAWLAGANVNWNGFYGKERRHRISLPTYPFERQRYWIEPLGRAVKQLSNTIELPEIDDQTSKHPRPSISTNYQSARNKIEEDIAKVWQTLLGFEKVGVFDNYFDIGGDSLSASQIISRLREVFGVEIPIDEFFEKPFVSAIADYISKTRSLRENILKGTREKRAGYVEI